MTAFTTFLLSGFVLDFAYFVLMFFPILLFLVAEILFPAERGHTWRGRIRNIQFISVFQLAGGVLLNTALFFLLPLLSQFSRFAEVHTTFESTVIILAHILAGDAIFYWYHRAQHTFPRFWAIHELHHSDTELNVTTSLRTYLFERPLQFISINVPLMLLVGATPALSPFVLSGGEALILYFVSNTWLFFAHANIRLRLLWLSYLFTAPQTHRIHHSIEDAHKDKNFAQFFPLLDVLFGTYYHPQAQEFPKTGTPQMVTGITLRKALLKPFQIWIP